MGSWCRNERMALWSLLPVTVDLNPEQWYTLGDVHMDKQGKWQREPRYGQDHGGHVWIRKELAERIESKEVFKRFSVQRYWLDDYPEWKATAGKSLLVNGDREFTYTYRLRDKGILLGHHYAVAISFDTPSEAMAFKLMVG